MLATWAVSLGLAFGPCACRMPLSVSVLVTTSRSSPPDKQLRPLGTVVSYIAVDVVSVRSTRGRASMSFLDLLLVLLVGFPKEAATGRASLLTQSSRAWVWLRRLQVSRMLVWLLVPSTSSAMSRVSDPLFTVEEDELMSNRAFPPSR